MAGRIKKLESIRVASPCKADWDAMSAAGDDRTRFCRECDKHVYDLASMTRRQVATLVSETQGKLCARFSFRPDGTLLTLEPAAPRAPRGRMSRIAAAAFTAVFTFCTSVFAQTATQARESPARTSAHDIKRADNRQYPGKDRRQSAKLHGTVYDIQGAVIPKATVTLTNERTRQERKVETNDEGFFIIDDLENGSYTFVAEAPGFFLFKKPQLKLGARQEMLLDVTLQVGMMGEIIILDEPPVVENLTRNFVIQTLSRP